jgi:CDP-glycerol glycerophosphotransferase
MLFYTYDLDNYRDELRGFYFDFEKDAPGPLLRHTSEVIAALQDLSALEAQFADAYADFRERFTSLEDGRASARFIDGFFG